MTALLQKSRDQLPFQDCTTPLLLSSCVLPSRLRIRAVPSVSVKSSHRMHVSLGKVVTDEFPWGDLNPEALDVSPGALQYSEAEPCWPFKVESSPRGR